MSYSNKKGKKHDLKTWAIEAYIDCNSKYNLDSTELNAFESFVCEKIRRVTKEELMNTEKTINDYIETFIRDYSALAFCCLPICLHNNMII